MNVESINELSEPKMIELFRQCCGSTAWCEAMTSLGPFSDSAALHEAADRAFDGLATTDWMGAFSCHPKIGDIDSLRMKYAGNKQWSASEQSGVALADDQTIQQLIDGNREYETRFGFIFIVCASGKQASEMLAILRSRLHNNAAIELRVASDEQRKITHLRIDKLLNSPN